jgi:hypothetical protein
MKALSVLAITTLAFLSILLLACHKNNQQPDLSSYYPNKTGDTWQYDIIDSAQSTPNNPTPPVHYSVKVTIVGTRTLPDGKAASIWQYQYPSANDTNYVRLKGDTVQIFRSNSVTSLSNLNFPDLIFLIPFQNSLQWNGKLYGVDSYITSEPTSFSYASQTFNDCYDVFHHYRGPNTELNDHYFFKPNVGIVSQKFIHYINGPILYETWQLRNFSIH